MDLHQPSRRAARFGVRHRVLVTLRAVVKPYRPRQRVCQRQVVLSAVFPHSRRVPITCAPRHVPPLTPSCGRRSPARCSFVDVRLDGSATRRKFCRTSRTKLFSCRRSATATLVCRPCRHAPLACPVGAPALAPWNRHTFRPRSAGAWQDCPVRFDLARLRGRLHEYQSPVHRGRVLLFIMDLASWGAANASRDRLRD